MQTFTMKLNVVFVKRQHMHYYRRMCNVGESIVKRIKLCVKTHQNFDKRLEVR